MASARRLTATLHSLLRDLALAHCSWSLLRAKHIRFVLPSASDNTSAESGVNRLFTTAEPLSTFLRLAAVNYVSCETFLLQGEVGGTPKVL